jgi:hypothetical protein
MNFMCRQADRTDEELFAIPAEHFPYNMTEAEQVRWLRLVPEDRLHVAERTAPVLQPDSVVRRISAEIERRVHVKTLSAVQAAVPLPPEPKKPLHKTWDFWKWVIASILLPIVLWCLKLLLGL